MLELILEARCIRCFACVRVCPNDVIEADDSGLPFIARQHDCCSCFLCEAYCAPDALYVAPEARPSPVDVERLLAEGCIGGFRRALGWDKRAPGAPTQPHAQPMQARGHPGGPHDLHRSESYANGTHRH
ncbi:MAG: ferredoxin family protein [Azoarcus sp.]|nr:ferredoxin family protein [Azoarcus sp.]